MTRPPSDIANKRTAAISNAKHDLAHDERPLIEVSRDDLRTLLALIEEQQEALKGGAVIAEAAGQEIKALRGMSAVHHKTIARIRDEAELLAAAAKASGVVVTIALVPGTPLAMGNYRTVIDVRPARHRPAAAAELPEPQPIDPVPRWIFDAVKTNLDALHAVCLEFGCSQGETVVDWLRTRLTAPIGYCIRHADGMRWRTLDSLGIPDWAVDEGDALCFSLRHHADAFAGDDPEDVRIVPRQRV